jgi:hypothetical protein
MAFNTPKADMSESIAVLEMTLRESALSTVTALKVSWPIAPLKKEKDYSQ